MSTVTRYMHSAYVKKSSCPELTAALEHDMHVFGNMTRQAFAARNTNRDGKDIKPSDMIKHTPAF